MVSRLRVISGGVGLSRPVNSFEYTWDIDERSASVTDKIVFHIGLHKTATTWFQRHLFPNLPGVESRRSKRIDEICAGRGNGATLLISHKSLSGTLSSEKQPGDNKKRLAQSLAHITTAKPGAAIIVGFRGHASWLGAAYAHKAKKEGVNFARYVRTFSADDLSWCRSLDLIEGASLAVFPFLYEELTSAPEPLIEDLCRFLGTRPPGNLNDLLARRENPSPRSRAGQLVSRPFFQISYALDRLPGVKTKRLREFGARLGARFDGNGTREVVLDRELAGELKQDWDGLLARICRSRGKDFSAFSTEG